MRRTSEKDKHAAAVEWLGDFNGWILDTHGQHEMTRLEGRQWLRRNLKRVRNAFDAEPRSPRQTRALVEFTEYALDVLELEARRPDLDELLLQSLAGGDFGGNHNFRSKMVRHWFLHRFVAGHDARRAKWDASGLTLADLARVQSPAQRKQLGLYNTERNHE